jgi:heat shock protein HtpX
MKEFSMSSSLPLAGRLALAVGWLLGYYLLSVAVVVALLYIPYVEWTYAGKLHVNLSLFCVLGAGIVLWAILPRPDRFAPQGLLLNPNDHPKLFEVLAEITKATRQVMPSELYLIPEVNAWVLDRGGILGYGSRRVMGIGLPLLQVLSVSQLRAVLAHEFGHFHEGDTKFGPWIYRTRTEIGRTLDRLARYRSLLQKPFLWYGKAFLRVTHTIARHQEFSADALAARLVGCQPLIEALKLTYSAAVAFDSYWLNEVAPVLRRGLHPPLAEGFNRYLASPRIAPVLATGFEQELAVDDTNPYDTHPSLRDRIAAVQHLPRRRMPETDPPAISLLGDISGLESRLIRTTSAEPLAQEPEVVAWKDVGWKVWVPTWETSTRDYVRALTGMTPSTLPHLAQNLDSLPRRLWGSDPQDIPTDESRRQVSALLGIALALALSQGGWELCVLPGEDAVCERHGTRIKPFDVVSQLTSGELTPEAWQEFCIKAEIADLDLGGNTFTTDEASSLTSAQWASKRP